MSEWQARGLELPDLDLVRSYRLKRVREELKRRGWPAILLNDPLNTRYATDSTNMQLWSSHNAVRYALVTVEGPVIVFDFHGGDHLCDHLPLVDQVRPAKSWTYMDVGEEAAARAAAFAAEIKDVLDEVTDEPRLAIDQIEPHGVHAFEALGVRGPARPCGHGAGPFSQIGGRNQGHALCGRCLRNRNAGYARCLTARHQRTGALGAIA